jgi:integrase
MQKRNRKQNGTIIRIGDRWFVRYWERRNTGDRIECKRVTHLLGPVTTRGKHPPADIKNDAEQHMAIVNGGAVPAERIVTIDDFVERVYLPSVAQHKRPSTHKGYKDIWDDHLKPLCAQVWLKNTRTFTVQEWLNEIGKSGKLSRNSLQHIKSVISGIFTLAKQLDYFRGENPARDTRINPGAREPRETYAYTLDEIQAILRRLPEPASTAFAVAAFMGLRHGEIQGLLWENYRDGEMFVSRSIWNGRVSEPKTRKGRAPVPVIRQVAERLELHRLRNGNKQAGPIFANTAGKPLALTSTVNRIILPALNRCEVCNVSETEHQAKDGHNYKRDAGIPEWHGWHAARRGLGSNLYRLGVPEIVIQRILRHANVSTTATYYIKTAAEDVKFAMTKLESSIPVESEALTDTYRTVKENPSTVSPAVN